MSTEAMEVLIIILSGILIIGAVWESGKVLLRYVEANRERWRRDAWNRKQQRGGHNR